MQNVELRKLKDKMEELKSKFEDSKFDNASMLKDMEIRAETAETKVIH